MCQAARPSRLEPRLDSERKSPNQPGKTRGNLELGARSAARAAAELIILYSVKDKREWSKMMLLGESAADISNLSPIFSLEVP